MQVDWDLSWYFACLYRALAMYVKQEFTECLVVWHVSLQWVWCLLFQ